MVNISYYDFGLISGMK